MGTKVLPADALAGLQILITRPREQAQRWAAQLEGLGAETQLNSVMAIEPINDRSGLQTITDRILALDHYQKLIFVSQNAVHYGLAAIDRYWPQWPQPMATFAVGATTARLLADNLGVIDSAVQAPEVGMNSEALLALAPLQTIAGEKILIFRGLGGRPYLGEQLQQRGAQVDYVALYRRVCPPSWDTSSLCPLKQSTKIPIITVHSGESLANLCSLVGQDDLHWLQQQSLLVPGTRVAKQAAERGFQHIITAENATHNSMVETLYDWYRRQ